MKYYTTIEFTSTKSVELEIEARDHEEAYRIAETQAKATCPEGYSFSVDGVEDEKKAYTPIGTCETSGRPIWEDSEYYSDEEGIMWLKEYDDREEPQDQSG